MTSTAAAAEAGSKLRDLSIADDAPSASAAPADASSAARHAHPEGGGRTPTFAVLPSPSSQRRVCRASASGTAGRHKVLAHPVLRALLCSRRDDAAEPQRKSSGAAAAEQPLQPEPSGSDGGAGGAGDAARAPSSTGAREDAAAATRPAGSAPSSAAPAPDSSTAMAAFLDPALVSALLDHNKERALGADFDQHSHRRREGTRVPLRQRARHAGG